MKRTDLRSDFAVYNIGMGMLRLYPADSVAGGVLRKSRKGVRIAGAGVLDAQEVVLYGGLADGEARPSLRIKHVQFGFEVAGRCTCGRNPAWSRSVCGHVLALRDLYNSLAHDPAQALPSAMEGLLAGRDLSDAIGEGLAEDDRDGEFAAIRERRQREAEARARQALAALVEPAAEAAAAPHRLSWKITGAELPAVAMLIQKQGRGGWTPGRVVHRTEELRLAGLALDIHDHQLLGLAALGRLDRADGLTLADWRLVAAHPRLLGPDGAALRAVETEVAVAVRPGAHGLDIALADVPAGARLPGRDVLAVVAGGILHLCPLTPAQARLAARPIAVPAALAADPALGEAVVALAADLPPAMAGEPVPGETAATLRLAVGDDAVEASIGVQPHALAAWHAPGHGPERLPVRDPAGERPWRVIARDLAAEAAAGAALRQRLGLGEGWSWILDLAAAADVVERAAAAGIAPAWSRQPLRTAVLGSGALQVRIHRGRQWLDVQGGIATDAGTLSLADALAAARANRGWIAVGGGRLVRLGEDLRRRMELLEAAQGPGADLAAPLLDAAVEGLAAGQVDIDQAFVDLRRRLADARACEPDLPAGLRAELRDYQRAGFAWMARLAAWGAGAVLADDMGLGKTLQAIAMLLRRRGDGPSLVVCPTSVEANWAAELRRFAPDLAPRLFRDGLGEPAAGDVVIASYGLVQRRGDALAGVAWGTLVVDEAHLAKNADAKRSKALAAIPAGWRLALTGTPVENRLDELWAVMRLAVPGLLGERAKFHEQFAKPMAAGDQAVAARLRRRIGPFVLRRTKEAVLAELPPLTEAVRIVRLADHERQVYEAEQVRAAGELSSLSGQQQRIAILAALTRLRQAACAARLILPAAPPGSSKLDLMAEILAELKAGRHQALVFSQFTRLLDLAEERLRDSGLRWLRLDGSTPAEARAGLVARFQAGEADAFLISLKAGGTGLNLTAASYVLHLDPWWNPAAEDQATDRAHRLGQDKPVTVYRLVAAGTIEEKIIDLHREKRDLVDAVLAESAGAASLGTDDLLALVRAAV